MLKLQFKNKKALFCAIDMKEIDTAISLIHQIKDYVDGVKLGMEAFYSMGIDGYKRIQDLQLPIFLDLKLHDIPNTVSSSLESLVGLKPYMKNVHTLGGKNMLEDAVLSLNKISDDRPLLIGVTILTSMDKDSFYDLGLNVDIQKQVIELSKIAFNSGLDGVVCSALEAKYVKEFCGPGFLTVVPGIRPSGFANDDQKRMMSPINAMNNGADILIVGRPITNANSPVEVAKAIRKDLEDYDSKN